MVDNTVFTDDAKYKSAIMHGMCIASMLTSRCNKFYVVPNNEEVNDIEEQDKEKTEVKVLSSQRGHITLSFYIISIFIALVIGGVIGYYVKSISEDNTINNRIDRQQEQLDSIRASIVSNQNDTTINESTTQNNDDVKYDTITPYRLITTMAEEYYGDMNFWTYIYEENKNDD